MNDTRTVKLLCEYEYVTLDRRNVARPRKRWTDNLIGKQAWNVLYLAAAAGDDNDTTFSYVTDRSVANTIHSRCYSASVDTTNTESCCTVSSIWDCSSSSQPDMWPTTLSGWVHSLQPVGLWQRNFIKTTLAMLRSTEWLVIIFIALIVGMLASEAQCAVQQGRPICFTKWQNRCGGLVGGPQVHKLKIVRLFEWY
jgi:hypothetical protein